MARYKPKSSRARIFDDGPVSTVGHFGVIAANLWLIDTVLPKALAYLAKVAFP